MIIKNNQSPLASFLFNDTRLAWFWIIVRIYVGYEWFVAGWEKLGAPAWTGEQAGAGIKGFLMGALSKTSSAHPDVTMWYASFINHIIMPNAVLFSYIITYGEIAVGIALILGLFTGLAALGGAFMNINYLLAGTISSNPVLLILQIFIIMARSVAGYFGFDGLMPYLKKNKNLL